MGFFSGLLKVAKAVAPIAIGFIPGVGPLAGAAIGGAIGAAGGGGIKGGLLGAAGGFAGAGGLSGVIGTAAHVLPAGVSGPVTAGSGILGALGSAGTAISGAGNSLTNLLGTAGKSILGGSGSSGGGNPLLSLANVGASLYGANAGANAANKAAGQQAASANAAIQAQKDALTQVRGDLQPFRDAGTATAGGLTQLVNDPNAQASFIQNNPFYQSLADDAKNKLFANAAARGKVGSGGTAAALQNSLLLLGNDLLNQDISRKQNLTTLGANAAAQTGTATQNTANQTSGLITDRGNAQAAGTIGGYNARTGAINNAIGTATSLYGIDRGVRV